MKIVKTAYSVLFYYKIYFIINLDMLADVAVARRQREKEGDSDAAGIREYQASTATVQ